MNPLSPNVSGSSFDVSWSPVPISSEIAEHLNRQVRIVSDLLDHQQHSLTKPEQDWIQNAINYTRYLLDSLRSHKPREDNNRKLYQRLQALHTATLRKSQTQAQAASVGSQLLVAMQNLNSAMDLLTHSARATPQPSYEAVTHFKLPEHINIPKIELSLFLNRRRIERHSIDLQQTHPLDGKVQDKIAELRGSNSLHRSNTRRMFSNDQGGVSAVGGLPLTLVETVEIWRQNAEDALKAAMFRYFEQEELLRDMTDSSTAVDGSVQDEVEPTQDSPPIFRTAQDWRQFGSTSSTAPQIVTEQTLSQLNRGDSASSNIPRRKLVGDAVPFPFLSAPPISPSSTSTALSPNLSTRSATSNSPSTSMSRCSILQSFGTNIKPSISLDQALSPSSTAPELSPFSTLQSDALTSNVSLMSAEQRGPRSPSFDGRTDSTVSLPAAPPNVIMQDPPAWHQPEARPNSQKHKSMLVDKRKSRGRVWLERQAALCQD